mgnify:FL=1
MNILFATSEVVPFSKTGGLADVSGALPVALANAGQQAAVITPAYGCVKQCGAAPEDTGAVLEIPIGNRIVEGRILKSRLPDSEVPIYFVQQDDYFHRPQLYQENGQDYRDNCERFVFFSRAVAEAVRLLELDIDIIHCNDWQTGLVPAYLKIEYQGVPRYENIASVFTIHNLAYQGRFWHWDMLITGLDWKFFNWNQMEFYGDLSLMKTGIVFADWITTVSPTYAQEIQFDPLGCGLEGALGHRRDQLTGILNGVDYRAWDPATDEHLETNYTVDNWQEGKASCKAALQRDMGLPQHGVPLVGFIGRLDAQKGLDLIRTVIEQRVEHEDVQYAILGSGHKEYEDALRTIASHHPKKVAVRTEFSNELAHRIEAGSDIFLMPSRYEPCGLNQMYSLKYGTVPIVRATGGLADTIVDCQDATLADRTANGFTFADYHPEALHQALGRALGAYTDKATWKQLVETGMHQDWSWARSAGRYVSLYENVLARQRAAP